MIELRDLTDASGGTCDWGGCDDETVAERRDLESDEWLPVCGRHTGPRKLTPSPGRGTCRACGKDYALSTTGKVRAHDAGFAVRCPGGGQPPTNSTPPLPKETAS